MIWTWLLLDDYFEMKFYVTPHIVLVLDASNMFSWVCFNVVFLIKGFWAVNWFEILIFAPKFFGLDFPLIEFYEHIYWSGNVLAAWIKEYHATQVPRCSFCMFFEAFKTQFFSFLGKNGAIFGMGFTAFEMYVKIDRWTMTLSKNWYLL